MDVTPRWEMPLLFAGQAQKEIFHNEALARIDMLLHGMVESADIGSPPAAPEPGQAWIVAASASGEWAGRFRQIAFWTEGGWRFIMPHRGIAVEVRDHGHRFVFDGEDWQADGLRHDGLYIEQHKIVGARQPAIATPSGGVVVDVEARSTIAALLATLRMHGLIME